MNLTRFHDRPSGMSAENWALLAEATIDSYAKQLKAAIARAEKEKAEADEMHDEALKNLKGKVNAEIQRDTARAAHAESIGLLRGTLESLSVIDESLPEMVGRCVHGSFVGTEQSIRDHLAKYGKDASK